MTGEQSQFAMNKSIKMDIKNPKEAANELNYKYSFATWDYVKE